MGIISVIIIIFMIIMAKASFGLFSDCLQAHIIQYGTPTIHTIQFSGCTIFIEI